MALESFYGGKPGISPVIRSSFKFINDQDPAYQAKSNMTIDSTNLSPKEKAMLERAGWTENNENQTWGPYLKYFTMDECFKDTEYRDVWYSEFCIIDTENKMNPNNGKLFRRTLKRVDTVLNAGDTNWAEYMGQIVGPSGGVPNIRFGSIDDVRKQAAGLQNTLPNEGFSTTTPADITGWDYSYPDSTNSNSISTENLITQSGVIGDTIGTEPQNREHDYEYIAVLDSGDSNNITLVPGKDANGYNDKIRYTWCNVRRTLTNGNDSDAWIYLGFEIPYTFYEVEHYEKNFTYDGEVFVNNSSKPTDEEYHPFYKKYEFNIPRGARGIGPKSIICIREKKGETAPSPLYNTNTIAYSYEGIYNEDGTIKIPADNYYIPDETEEYDPNEESYWVAEWILHNPRTGNVTPETVYQYLGAYKDIDTITIDTTINSNTYGDFTVNYSDGTTYKTNLHLVKNATYNDSTGKFTFEYSGMNDIVTGNIVYPKQIDIDTDQASNTYGKVTIYKNTDFNSDGTKKTNAESTVIATLPLIKESSYDKNSGEIIFTYTGDPSNIKTTIGPIHDIKEMEINEDNGHLIVYYHDDSTNPVDLGLVKTTPNFGPSASDSFGGADNISNIEAYLNKLNQLSPSNSEPTDDGKTLWEDGHIENGNTDMGKGFVTVTDNNTSPATNYIIYHNGTDWVVGGTLGDSSSSGAFYSETENPTSNDRTSITDFTFIVNTNNNIETGLILPDKNLNYGSSS